MDEHWVMQIREEYVGVSLTAIIDIDLNNGDVISALRDMTGDEYSGGVANAKILLFADGRALVFVDFDCDGYRSGDWHLLHLSKMLDKNQTKGIKFIRSVVSNIEFFEGGGIPETWNDDTRCIIITTDEYVIRMGQTGVSDYYPCNFFDLLECKRVALGIKEQEVV